jgi:hypothetical protein
MSKFTARLLKLLQEAEVRENQWSAIKANMMQEDWCFDEEDREDAVAELLNFLYTWIDFEEYHKPTVPASPEPCSPEPCSLEQLFPGTGRQQMAACSSLNCPVKSDCPVKVESK